MGYMDPWKDEEEEVTPATEPHEPKPIDVGSPETSFKDPLVREHLLERYRKAADDSDVKAARDSANSTSKWMGVAEGIGKILTANSVARGGQQFDGSVLRGVAQNALRKVADAQQARQDRMNSVLTEDKLQQQGGERERDAIKFGWEKDENEHKGKMRGFQLNQAEYDVTTGRKLNEDKTRADIAGSRARTAGQNISNSAASLELNDQKSARDPDSRTSASARLLGLTRVSQMMKQAQERGDSEGAVRLGEFQQVLKDPNTTAAEVQSMGLLMDKVDYQKLIDMELKKRRVDQGDTRLNIQQGAEDRRNDQFADKKTQKLQDDYRGAIDSVRKTETWKASEKTLSEMPTIRSLLTDAYANGGQSLSMLGPKVAKAIAGETGQLTDADVLRYVKNPALVPGIMDEIARARSGQIGQESFENLTRLVDIAEQEARRKQGEAVAREAELLSRREGIPLDEARFHLDETAKRGVQSAPAPKGGEVKRKTKDGRTAVFNADTKEFIRYED